MRRREKWRGVEKTALKGRKKYGTEEEWEVWEWGTRRKGKWKR